MVVRYLVLEIPKAIVQCKYGKYGSASYSKFIKSKRGGFMLGLTDPGVIAAFLFSIGSALLCVIYGVINWNND